MGGDLLYRWGNPQAYRAGGTEDRKFYAQHDPLWILPGLPGAGHMTVFNNGKARPGSRYSTVDEFIPACDSAGNYARPAPGTPFGPAAQYWIYAATPPTSFYSATISGAHRLPNGNTINCEGNSGRFFEVTRDSQVVWYYLNPVTDSIRLFQGDTIPGGMLSKQNATFRVTRYAPDYPGLAGKDLTPGYPLERYHSPATGVAEAPARPGLPRLSVSPNPFRGSVLIKLDHGTTGPLDRFSLHIFDAAGRRVRSLHQSGIYNLESGMAWDGRDASGRLCPPGVYFIQAADGARQQVVKAR